MSKRASLALIRTAKKARLSIIDARFCSTTSCRPMATGRPLYSGIVTHVAAKPNPGAAKIADAQWTTKRACSRARSMGGEPALRTLTEQTPLSGKCTLDLFLRTTASIASIDWCLGLRQPTVSTLSG
jgi:hypothetical protein